MPHVVAVCRNLRCGRCYHETDEKPLPNICGTCGQGIVHSCLNCGLIVAEMLKHNSDLFYCTRCGERVRLDPLLSDSGTRELVMTQGNRRKKKAPRPAGLRFPAKTSSYAVRNLSTC